MNAISLIANRPIITYHDYLRMNCSPVSWSASKFRYTF
jgi:hypothetical protein